MGIMMIAGTERRRQGCSLQDGKQWGKILGDTVNLKIINFPVSFNECFGGLALFNGDPVAAAEYATITDITNTNFKIYMYANNAGTGYANANIFYLFLGAQPQWGYLQKQAEKWIYPIPVLEAFIATKTCISNNHSAAGYVGYWTWDKDITTEYAYSWNNYPSYCFMIGKVQQQWGYCVGKNNVTFPIPFNSVWTVLGNAHGSNNSNNDHYFLGEFSTTGARFYYSNMNLTGTAWIAIGDC